MGRPKGRNYQQYKIYLTPNQIKWLKRPRGINSSLLFRCLLDAHMRSELSNLKDEAEKESKKLESLKAELSRLNASWTDHSKPPPRTWDIERNIEKTEAKLIQANSEIRKLEKCLYK